MSYNITHCETLKCNAWISAKNMEEILEHEYDWFPERSFITDAKPFKIAKAGKFVIKKFDFSGECSGTLFSYFLENVAPKIKGELEVILTWEGGESITGLRIKNGTITQPKVVKSLADE